MSKFRQEEKKGQPAVSTAALPDIVFMLLFFFMIAASLKTDNYDQFIKLEKPKATELTKLEKKDLIPNIYVGRPNNQYQAKYGKDYILVVNDKPSVSMDVVIPYLQEFKSNVNPEDHSEIIPQLTIDKDAKVGYVKDLEEQIGFAGIFTISYGAKEGEITENLQ